MGRTDRKGTGDDGNIHLDGIFKPVRHSKFTNFIFDFFFPSVSAGVTRYTNTCVNFKGNSNQNRGGPMHIRQPVPPSPAEQSQFHAISDHASVLSQLPVSEQARIEATDDLSTRPLLERYINARKDSFGWPESKRNNILYPEFMAVLWAYCTPRLLMLGDKPPTKASTGVTSVVFHSILTGWYASQVIKVKPELFPRSRLLGKWDDNIHIDPCAGSMRGNWFHSSGCARWKAACPGALSMVYHLSRPIIWLLIPLMHLMWSGERRRNVWRRKAKTECRRYECCLSVVGTYQSKIDGEVGIAVRKTNGGHR
ncbi:hypothetical protein ASPSYDRAFT_32729 [Aspergillus sydowii CBS 593.65]|uniref:Uncharacterized protein n=1 Tax=Aspergillus sydowii CBS 593.65 TaxID=1036612 RepID=A0A1L9TDS9_9EURO|nr:uncharacterized protein ASPSYDRAFT_32729 [Aspergillus sydowii CBS 593.65]OJJ57590.1 hypothetical protein ASPSYDRAFT_32729 [Aspergillus sydowii CBS 593.65]